MFFGENIDGNMKFRYIYMIIDHEMNKEQLNSFLIHPNSPELSESRIALEPCFSIIEVSCSLNKYILSFDAYLADFFLSSLL